MRIAIMLSRAAVGAHGPIDFGRWRQGRALTGTELATIHVARGLSERGHVVDLYCADATQDALKYGLGLAHDFGGVRVFDFERAPLGEHDVSIAVSDPRLLADRTGFRVNWSHAAVFYGDVNDADAHVFVSPTHRRHVLAGTPGLLADRTVWIPNALDMTHFDGEAVRRRPYSMAWLSSPDRGLHRLLELWPEIRARVPAATLRVFYRFDPWIEEHRGLDSLHGERARYIEGVIQALGRNGENGITIMGPVSHVDFVRELQATWVVPYTYDPPGPLAEAFCIAMLDACAAGCTPICSDQDALGDNFAGVAEIIPGRPGDSRARWLEAIIVAATHENRIVRHVRKTWARNFDRHRVAVLWDRFLRGQMIQAPLDVSMMPTTIKEFAPCT